MRGPWARKDGALGGLGPPALEPETGRIAGTLQDHPHSCPQGHPPAGPGKVPSDGRRCQGTRLHGSSRGPADGSLPRGTPPPLKSCQGSEGPASPAATKRRALLRELRLRCRPLTGRVRGWWVPSAEGTVREQRGPHALAGAPTDKPRAEPREGSSDMHSDEGTSSHSAAQRWLASPQPLPSLSPVSSQQSPESAVLGPR